MTASEDRLTQLEKEAENKRVDLENESKNRMKQLKVRQEEIEEAARLKAELRKQGMDTQTLIKTAKGFNYEAQKVDAAGLRKAIQEFGSLKKAAGTLGRQKRSLAADVLTLEQRILLLEHDLQIKERTTGGQMVKLDKLEENIRSQLKEQKIIMNKISRRAYQYRLFESLVAMLLTSPSRKGNLMELATHITELYEKGWEPDESPGQLRLFFVYTVLGKSLHCYRCDSCGTKFIINKEPHGPIRRPNCPVCSSLFSVKGDGSFVEALSNADNTAN